MAEIRLVPRGRIGITVEAEVIRPDLLAGKTEDEIGRLIVWQGPRELPLSQFFEVELQPCPGGDEDHHRWRCITGKANRPGYEVRRDRSGDSGMYTEQMAGARSVQGAGSGIRDERVCCR